MKSKIASLNPGLVSKDGFIAAPRDEKEIKVEFTNAAEQQVIELISSFDDSSSDSEEVFASQGRGDYINVQTAQFLRAMDFSRVETALEISADYGNIARFLGEQIAQVESVKALPNTARASAYRCADLANVATVCGAIVDLQLPAGGYDFILLADLEKLVASPAQRDLALDKVASCLKPDGVLALISTNPKPVSAWFSADQEIPYRSLYRANPNAQAQSDWRQSLQGLGFNSLVEHCFLPNGRNGKSLLAKHYLQQEPGAINHFYGAGIANDEKLNEYLLFNQLATSNSLFDLCDDYLTLCAHSQVAISALYNNDFTHYSSPGRRGRWRTLTSKAQGSKQVEKRLLTTGHQAHATVTTPSGIGISQDLTPLPYQSGQSLAGTWLDCLLSEDSVNQFEDLLEKYHAWLLANSARYEDALYDILPFNLIVDEQGEYQVIDPEWHIQGAASPEFVTFRALFWFGFHNRQLLRTLATAHGLFSLDDFVNYGLKLLGYQSDIEAFSKIETEIQSQIEKQFNQQAINETLRLPITLDNIEQIQPLLPKAQVFWCDDADNIDFSNSVSLALNQLDQRLEINASLISLDVSKKMLRIDPVDRAGFFQFHQLEITDEQGKSLWLIDSQAAINEIAEVRNAVFAETDTGGLYIAQNDDPQFIFDLTGVASIDGAAGIRLSLSYSHSRDYIVAMQQLGRETLLQKEFIVQQRNELESVRARYSELGDNFEFLKNVSSNQNDLIEQLMKQAGKSTKRLDQLQARIEGQEQHAADQQKVIEAQLEMMQRTRMARLKLFIARLRGQQPEVEEVAEIEVDPAPVVMPKPEKLGQDNDDYQLWIKQHRLTDEDKQRIRAEIDAMPLKPLFSIVVPVYDIEEEYLMLAVNSLRGQLYPNWELCLVDDASPKAHIRPMLKRLAAVDPRIVVKLNKDNQGIAGASNDAVRLTTGDYVGLLDHDDELSIDALYENAKVINAHPDVGFIYSDEDKITMDERRVDPFFKPDYSPDLLDSQNYICHFSVISQKVVDKIGGFRLGFDGSQDHDIIMRAIQNSEHIEHIPKVLYHWRKVPGSTAEVYDAKSYAWEAGRKAVEARLRQSGEKGHVDLGPLQGTYQVKRDIIGEPKVSIIIPFKDRADLLKTCIDSILRCNDYLHYEIIGVSNNSEEEATHAAMAAYSEAHDNIRFVEHNVPFNFSAICNYGVAQSEGDYVLLLNNDIKVQSLDWLVRLLEHAQRDGIGAVGGKLFFPDGRIQHAGVVAGMHGAAGHSHLYFAPNDIGYYGSLMVTRNVSAVTGAMLMVSRQKYLQVGGLDADNLAVAYNDVDLCLKLLDAGYLNIFTPFAQAIHYESASRGYEDNPEKLARLEKERDFFLQKWHDYLQQGDKCFNPNFDLNRFDFGIKLDTA